MQRVASTLRTTLNHAVSSITTADGAHFGCQQLTELTAPPTDLDGLVRFAERLNLVSARMPSHFNWPQPWLPLLSWLLPLTIDFLGIIFNQVVTVPMLILLAGVTVLIGCFLLGKSLQTFAGWFQPYIFY